MSDRGEAYLSAIDGEEDEFIDKETINHQFKIMLELDELLGNLDNTLRHALAFPFILRTDRPQITSAALTSWVVTFDPWTPPTLTIPLKSGVEG
jgi:hypothetical protein